MGVHSSASEKRICWNSIQRSGLVRGYMKTRSGKAKFQPRLLDATGILPELRLYNLDICDGTRGFNGLDAPMGGICEQWVTVGLESSSL